MSATPRVICHLKHKLKKFIDLKIHIFVEKNYEYEPCFSSFCFRLSPHSNHQTHITGKTYAWFSGEGGCPHLHMPIHIDCILKLFTYSSQSTPILTYPKHSAYFAPHTCSFLSKLSSLHPSSSDWVCPSPISSNFS